MSGFRCCEFLRPLFKKRQAAQADAKCRRLLEAAQEAETAGEHLRAAELLEQVCAVRPDQALRLRTARCWLLAEQWRQSADAYMAADSSAASDCYDVGFALAKTGCFADCLRFWQRLDSRHPDFLAQQKQVGLLFLQELNQRLNTQPLAQEAEVRELLHEFSLTELAGGKDILARCDLLRLAQLWQEDQVQKIMDLVEDNYLNSPLVLEMQAKAACRILLDKNTTASAALLRCFMDSWLSALFHPAISRQVDEEQRQALLDFGEDLLRRHSAHSQENVQLMQEWSECRVLLTQLAGLTAVQQQGLPVCTPATALRTGLSGRFCQLIRESRAEFADRTAWTKAGAAYGTAAAFALVRAGACQDALDELAQLEAQREDPFLLYGAAQVRTACGVAALQCCRWQEAEEILVNGDVQAVWSEELQQQLLVLLGQENNCEAQWPACLSILSLLPKTLPADETARAFCAALTQLTVRLHNQEQASPQLLAAAMQQAVALNPADEFARMMLDEVSIAVELAELHEAVDQGWLTKAGRIAAASQYQQVAEHFFTAAQQIAVQLEQGVYPDNEAASLILEDLLHSVSRVDSSHQMLHGLRRALDNLRLQQGKLE